MRTTTLIAFLALSFTARDAGAAGTGFVTPSEMTITFTELRLITADNKNLTLMSGTFPHTFKRTDTDFAAVSLAAITAPEGRFVGVQICYNTDRSVKLNGDTYHGASGGTLVEGDLVYSIGTTATATNSIQEAATSTPTTLTGYTIGNGTNNCSQSYFAKVVCVSTDTSNCESTDTVVNPSTTVPNLNILMDLLNSVGVDATNSTLDNHVPIYPYPTIGPPGAALRLSATSGATIGNISLLFDSSKSLLYSSSYLNSGSLGGVCSGVAAVTATAAPAGSFLNTFGPTFVQTYADATGKVQFTTGNCGTSDTCTSNGMLTIDNVKVAAGATAAVTCPADSAASPPFLGFTYTSGSGVSGGTTFTMKRIVDPGNIFGVCATSPCGSY